MVADMAEIIANIVTMGIGISLMVFSIGFLKVMRRNGALHWKEIGYLGAVLGFFLAFAGFWFILAGLYMGEDDVTLNFGFQTAGCIGLLFVAYYGATYTRTAAEKIEEVLL